MAGLEAGLRRGSPRALPLLFGLAPGGVCHAGDVAAAAVRSYRTVSPLPRLAQTKRGGLFSVALSLRSPPAAVSRHRASMEPGLSSTGDQSPRLGREARTPTATVQPADSAELCVFAAGCKGHGEAT